jgi:hypothetical protein
MTLPASAWLDRIEAEYLATFVREGGSAVRFAVADPSALSSIAHDLTARALRHGQNAITIDPATLKLHQLQHLFFAIARAIDWDALLQARLERLVAAAGYAWPRPGERLRLVDLAEANAVPFASLRRQITQEINAAIWKDTLLAQDFRSAIATLLECRLAGDRDPLADALHQWLTGTLTRLSLVKPAQIGARIARHNARAMLKSLFHLLRACGGHGILVAIDISRLLDDRRTGEGQHYTPAAVMDCYEVLRQMIDDADEMEGLFLAILADPRLLDAESRRGLAQYTALHMRVIDDVRPDAADNPLAPLVELA